MTTDKIEKCTRCKNILAKTKGKNGYYYTCYNCKTRYLSIEGKLIELTRPRFHLCENDPDLETWAVDDILTDGEYASRICKEEVVTQLNELDTYAINLIKENLELHETIAILNTKLSNKQDEQTKKLQPIQAICDKYQIDIEHLPEVLEEYISYDNAEYLEKLKNQ